MEPLRIPQLDRVAETVEYESVPPPLVTAIMAISNPQRISIAHNTAKQFEWQSYGLKELIIVNASGRRVTEDDEFPDVRELRVEQEDFPTLVSMLNEARYEAKGDWVIRWDDDDHHHPHRIAIQMAHRVDGACCLLAYQLRLDLRNTTICVVERAGGHASSILWPKYDAGEIPEVDKEDEAFLDSFHYRVVVDNKPSVFPGPALHMPMYHGRNMRSETDFFGEYADPKFQGRLNPGVTPSLTQYVQYAVGLYGVKTQVRTPGGENPG